MFLEQTTESLLLNRADGTLDICSVGFFRYLFAKPLLEGENFREVTELIVCHNFATFRLALRSRGLQEYYCRVVNADHTVHPSVVIQIQAAGMGRLQFEFPGGEGG